MEFKLSLLPLTLLAGFGVGQPLFAAGETATTSVSVQSTMSVSEIAQYVEDVDHRLQKGRYDVIEDSERKWMATQIADLRAALQGADKAAAPSADLQMLASNFETGMIKIEEGGIVCRQERRTGTRMVTQRCFSRKRLEEDTERSQDQLRDLVRPQALPSGG